MSHDAMNLGRGGRDPWVQLRERLEVSKRRGVCFRVAWRGATKWVLCPNDRDTRDWWKATVRDPDYVECWRRAYEDVPDPAAELLAVLTD